MNAGPLPPTNGPVAELAATAPPRFDAVLVGRESARAGTAVLAAGGRVAAAFGWADVPRVGEIRMAGRAVLVVEAGNGDEGAIADALPAVARLALERGLKVVATSDMASLDLVAAALWGLDVELLCEPDLPERIAALLRAANGGGRRELGAAPLVREDAGPAYQAEPPAEGQAPAAGDAEALRRAIRSRRLRDEFFMPGLFADPAWDMLLDLYAAEGEDHPVSVSSLCIAAAVAPTTALRWIQRMQEDGLLERRPDENDRRRAFMALTEVARLGMREYLDAVRRAGLGIA